MPFGGRTDARAAVAANIEKSVHAGRGIAGDNDAFAGDLTQNVVARSWNFGLAAGIDPHLGVEAVHFLAENLRVCVIATWKSPWRGRHFCLHVFPEALRFFGLIMPQTKNGIERRPLEVECDWPMIQKL